jgi:hypothetical protein
MRNLPYSAAGYLGEPLAARLRFVTEIVANDTGILNQLNSFPPCYLPSERDNGTGSTPPNTTQHHPTPPNTTPNSTDIWNVFGAYDGMIRRRLRRILQKRHRLNPQRLSSTRRWPNRYFSEMGLFSLSEAHTRFVQSTGTY